VLSDECELVSLRQGHGLLFSAETTPLEESSGTVGLEIVSAVEGALGVEQVVDRGVNGGEFLQTSHPPEPQYRPLPSSEGLVKILRPVVGRTGGLLSITDAEVPKRSTIGPQAVGHDRFHWIVGYATASFVAHQAGLNISGNLLKPALAVNLAGMVLSCAYTYQSLPDCVLRRNDTSYGAYIYHMPVFKGFIALGRAGTLINLTWALAMAVALAALSWLLIERHALKLKAMAIRPAPIAS
jgi:hypothetical protein